MLNKVQIIGRLGDKVELRHTQNGKAVANFSIATEQKGANGQKDTEWHKVIAWEKLAENCAQYLSKGKLCYIEGRLATRSYEKNGQKFYTTEIIAQQVQFLSPKEEGNPAGQVSKASPQTAPTATPVFSPFGPPSQSPFGDSDIPF